MTLHEGHLRITIPKNTIKILYLRTEHLKNPTLSGGTNLYGVYKEEPPGSRTGKSARKYYDGLHGYFLYSSEPIRSFIFFETFAEIISRVLCQRSVFCSCQIKSLTKSYTATKIVMSVTRRFLKPRRQLELNKAL